VAELGAAFLWLTWARRSLRATPHAVLNADTKAIFTAASAAAKATDILAGLKATDITEAAA
jgi:antirestriction protein ArdC